MCILGAPDKGYFGVAIELILQTAWKNISSDKLSYIQWDKFEDLSFSKCIKTSYMYVLLTDVCYSVEGSVKLALIGAWWVGYKFFRKNSILIFI